MRIFKETIGFYLNIAVCISLTIMIPNTLIGKESADIANNNIKVIQRSVSTEILNSFDSIILARESFSLQFMYKAYNAKSNEFYVTQIAVLKNFEDIRYLIAGTKIEDVPYFEPGTGMATVSDGSSSDILITNTGHHYLFYSSEQDRRLTLIKKLKGGFLELEWNIPRLIDGNTMSSNNFIPSDISVLYFVIFRNYNLNSTLDEGEIRLLQVNFK